MVTEKGAEKDLVNKIIAMLVGEASEWVVDYGRLPTKRFFFVRLVAKMSRTAARRQG